MPKVASLWICRLIFYPRLPNFCLQIFFLLMQMCAAICLQKSTRRSACSTPDKSLLLPPPEIGTCCGLQVPPPLPQIAEQEERSSFLFSGGLLTKRRVSHAAPTININLNIESTKLRSLPLLQTFSLQEKFKAHREPSPKP